MNTIDIETSGANFLKSGFKNKRPIGHISHLRNHVQFKSINTYNYHNKKPIIFFMRIEWFLIWTNLNPLHPRMYGAKFGWNWPSSSGEKDFNISSMCFCYFVIISPWKIGCPSFGQTWIPFNQGCIVPSLVEIGTLVLEKKIFKFRQYIFAISQLYLLELYLNKLKSLSPKEDLC